MFFSCFSSKYISKPFCREFPTILWWGWVGSLYVLDRFGTPHLPRGIPRGIHNTHMIKSYVKLYILMHILLYTYTYIAPFQFPAQTGRPCAPYEGSVLGLNKVLK